MLAHLPQTQRERWRHHLSAPTPLSIQDFDILQTDLALARERGYAVHECAQRISRDCSAGAMQG